MADNDQKRRFLRNRGRSVRPTDAAIPPSSETAAPAGVPAVPQRRPARAQASQDVVALVGFLRAAENRRAQGRPAPTPKSMRDVLGAFRGQPAQQITIQVLAAAATTRHLGAQSQNTRRWEQLAQENAARLEALRAQQYRREQQRYVQVQMPPEEIARRTAEILDRLSDVIRKRFELLSHARVLSAQQRYAAVFVGLSPFLFSVFFYFTSPGYFDPMIESPAAPMLIGTGVALEIVGGLIIWRIARIKV